MRVTSQRQADRAVIALSIAGIVAAASIASGLAVSYTPAGPDPAPARRVQRADDVRSRLAAVDEALARKDVSRAIYLWRDAHSVALGARRWDAMAAVGDAALRIDAATGPFDRPTGFRAEARQAYLRALFDARAAGERDGIERVADAFAALGDTKMAAQARALR
jgi:hypothetical protein